MFTDHLMFIHSLSHKTQLKDMADNVGVDVDGGGDESRTTSNLIWSLQSSRRDSDLAKVESVLCARENTMKNEIARLMNEWKDLKSEFDRWGKKYMQLEGRISVLGGVGR
ncbi:hypothetical protein Dsin_009522 [Dipteronia sinensis]|uniref:Uncharacterized protein n=1 Tax=Dipteronia sinensis TaxID=43782 RepID=A0AAE0AR43_9ROSI|nr:hypothetical protein Dsin_009522 [Dipteronia sinensis]